MKTLIKLLAIVAVAALAGCSLFQPSPLAETQPGDWITYRTGADARISVRTYGDGPCRLLLLGGVHGDETETTRVVRLLARRLPEEQELLRRITFFVVEETNPDALAARTRVNARKVDINRNFPTKSWSATAARSRYSPGPRPASEIETRAIMHLIGKVQPAAIVAVHAPLACVNWDGPADALAQSLAATTGLPLEPSIGYPTPGSLGSYAGVERRIPTVTLELPREVSEPDVFATQMLRALDGTSPSCW